ncbi:MAG: PAS domain-containing protein [Deltaproteobacteria bacterium]|nr:MAG: PAS domain-containing protein [Deltaproteobacteria bacterium]
MNTQGKRKLTHGKHIGAYISPWMIVGAVTILLIVVVVLAIRNINREKHGMAQVLSEKGAALIRSFEAGARTGMMGMMWGGDQVQNLLEETARQPDILYLAVTDKKGIVLAHSDKSKIGRIFRDEFSLEALNPETREQWKLTDHGTGRHAFEVYRYFQPLADCDPKTVRRRRRGMGGHKMMGQRSDWCFPSADGTTSRTATQQIIFVGLDVAPFEEARKEDIKHTLVISGVLMLLGFGGFVSLFLAENYRATKRVLQDTSAFADEVVANLPVGLIAAGRDGRIAFFNEAAETITGLNLSEARGREPDEVLPAHWCGLKDCIDQGQTILEQEMECVFANGESVPLSVSATRIVNEEGDFVGNILILRDLGEVRRLQEEIRRKEKLAALGSLAAGIAHEIRNPLSSIKGLATYFGNKYAETVEDKDSAGVMVREVDRLNRVISELLEFARPSELKMKPTDSNELLEHSLRLVQQDAKAENVEINLLTGDDLPLILLDPDRFSQALLNLYLNAIHAMEEGGTLSVKSSIGLHGDFEIEIADSGAGIDPNDLSKIFDPYFTTKSAGTGLGLAIVHKIIEAHEGDIKVKSEPGKGTIFTILIPIRENESVERGEHES